MKPKDQVILSGNSRSGMFNFTRKSLDGKLFYWMSSEGVGVEFKNIRNNIWDVCIEDTELSESILIYRLTTDNITWDMIQILPRISKVLEDFFELMKTWANKFPNRYLTWDYNESISALKNKISRAISGR